MSPFLDYQFLRLAALLLMAVLGSFTLVGTVLIQKRWSLIGDTLSHSLLPGVILGTLFLGTQLLAFLIGGLANGLILILAVWLFYRRGRIPSDSAMAIGAIVFISLGYSLATMTSSSTETLHLFFGNILATDESLILFGVFVSVITLGTFIAFYRPLYLYLVDPVFFETSQRWKWAPLGLGFLLVLNLVLGLATMGSILTVGLFLIPALIGQRLGQTLAQVVFRGSLASFVLGLVGLLISFHSSVPATPAIILTMAFGYVLLGLFKINHGSWIS